MNVTCTMARTLFFLLFCSPHILHGQLHVLPERLQSSDAVPDKLLSAKAVVLYASAYGQKERSQVQQAFQQIGIDAVAYYPSDWVLANTDITGTLAAEWNERVVTMIVMAEKKGDVFELYFTPFTGKNNLVEDQQPAWYVKHSDLNELLLTVYRDSWARQVKANFLINSFPEPGALPAFIVGRRMELYAIDLKVDYLAVPLTNDSTVNQTLRDFFKQYYPLRYKFVRLPENERDLRRQGFHYVLKYAHARGEALRQVLQYDVTKQEKAYASTTYPNGLSQLKMIPAEKPVYKFYFKQLESGHVYLGARWDADEDLLSALRNHIKALLVEMKIE
jgi:hypothetical protein